MKTYLVEWFWPGVTEVAHADRLLGLRTEAAAQELSSSGRGHPVGPRSRPGVTAIN